MGAVAAEMCLHNPPRSWYNGSIRQPLRSSPSARCRGGGYAVAMVDACAHIHRPADPHRNANTDARASDCGKIGGLAADDAVSLVGCTPDGKWYQVELGSGVVVLLWIAPSRDLAGGEL
jgi:hypothetical protein